jgi:formylmethanofuran dehydrogenase subunit E
MKRTRPLKPRRLPQDTSASLYADSGVLWTLMHASAQRHQHLCPRQVLGIRIGQLGLRELGFFGPAHPRPFHNVDKRLLTIVETDGCGADGICVATDCFVGRRTLRVVDLGKLAATLVDTHTGRAVRVAPGRDARQKAQAYAPEAPSRWHAYLEAYQRMPEAELLVVREVQLTQPVAEILSRPNARVNCASCGEEIMNERQVYLHGHPLCRHCAGERYYLEPQPVAERPIAERIPVSVDPPGF